MSNNFLHLGVFQTNELFAWDMEKLNGALVKDLTGNGNDGTITGTTVNNAGGWGKGRTFNGSSDKIVSSGFAGFGGSGSKLTLCAWVNPTSLTGAPAVFGQDTAGGIRFGINASGPLYFWANNNNAALSGTANIPLNTLTHVAVTYDDSTGTVTFYINGALDLTGTITANQMASTTGISVGANLSTRWFTGMIDETYAWGRVLSAAEVQAIGRPTQTRIVSPDGTWKIPLFEARMTEDMSREVAVAPLSGNLVTDIDVKMVRRQFSITGVATKYGAFAAQDCFNALEFLCMNYQDTTFMARCTLYWGNAATTTLTFGGTTYGGGAGSWKTYNVQIMRFTPLFDVEQGGGAPRVFPYTLVFAEGGTLANF